MSEKQTLVMSAFAQKMPNSKYVNQKRKLEAELKFFTNQYNYNKMSDFWLDALK